MPVYPYRNEYQYGEIVLENKMLEGLDDVPDEIYELLDPDKVGRAMVDREGGVFIDGYYVISRFVEAINKFTAKERRAQPEIPDKRAQLAHMNRGAAAVVTGAESRTRAVREIIHDMAEKGIPAFVDKRGREWSPEAYVNMDVRNTVKNTATDAAFGAMDALGQDVFEVSSHAGSRPKCRPWQGKFISKSGRTTEITDINGHKYKVYPLSETTYGQPDGLFGINCGHRPRGVTDGLFTRSAKTEEEYGEDDKELYTKICRQRELERRIRRAKTEAEMLEVSGDTEGAKEMRKKAAGYNKQLREYCNQNGLKYRDDRVRTYGKITAKKPDKDLTGGGNGGIIKVGSDGVAEKEFEYGVPYGEFSVNADMDYINSPEYAKKFDNITDNPNVNRTLLECSRAAITHRTGTLYEDMYIIDANSGDILASQLAAAHPCAIDYNDEIINAVNRSIETNSSIIALHTHPEGFPPSVDDFNSAFKHNYSLAVVAGHNGQVYIYSSSGKIINNVDDIQANIAFAYNAGIDVDRAYQTTLEDYGLAYFIVKG